MNTKRNICIFTATILTLLSASSCSEHAKQKNANNNSTAADSTLTSSGNAITTDADSIEIISFSPDAITVTDKRFFSSACSLSVSAPNDATVYYTTDGSEPNSNSSVFDEPIVLEPSGGNFPTCLLLKVKAVYADGSESKVITHTFFASSDIDTKFDTVLLSISGDPDDIFNSPDGIFYGNNYEKRGRESEIPIYIEAINSNGEMIFEQAAGARIFGAASREASIKSLKLFARKSYDPEHGKFPVDIFGTVGADGEVMNKYDKLVVRNAGNDFQFAFIRDELNQRLAQQAGYTDYEGVVPAVTYLNGEYYGLMWLHETYCDDLLKDKYGDGDGSFEVIEGNEKSKDTDDDDAENSSAAEEYNALYNRFAYSDLTDNSIYDELCSVIDVNNYLENYAFNICINNRDWPQNNYKCYRYYASDGEEYTDNSALDGRWRYIFHDTDYCMGLYQQEETQAYYNNIAQIMDENSERYSPLFTSLMDRSDCREYFLQEVKRLINSTLSYDNISQTLDSMNDQRSDEMKMYYKHLENMKKSDSTIWTWYDNYLSQTQEIKTFASDRSMYIKDYLTEQFDLSYDYFD